jgi:hypothetical protein
MNLASLSASIRACEAEHLMPRIDNLLNNRKQIKPRCSRNKNFHNRTFT